MMDSQEYFLKIVDSRTCQSVNEWTNVIHTFDRSTKDYENNHPSTFLPRARNEKYRDADIQTTYSWTIQTLNLMGYSLTVLAATVRVWDIFKSIDGDIGYFFNNELCSKTPGGFTQSALHSIKNAFVKLEDLQEQLLSLEKYFERLKTDLELRLTLESNDTAKKNVETAKENVKTASITVMMFSPFTLVTAYFSMPGSLIPFETTVSSYFITLAVSMLFVWLVFAIFSSMLSPPWHRKQLAVWSEKLGIRGIARRLVTGTQGIGVGMKRCLTFPNETTDEIEMTGFERRPWHDIRGMFRRRVLRGKTEDDARLPGP